MNDLHKILVAMMCMSALASGTCHGREIGYFMPDKSTAHRSFPAPVMATGREDARPAFFAKRRATLPGDYKPYKPYEPYKPYKAPEPVKVYSPYKTYSSAAPVPIKPLKPVKPAKRTKTIKSPTWEKGWGSIVGH